MEAMSGIAVSYHFQICLEISLNLYYFIVDPEGSKYWDQLFHKTPSAEHDLDKPCGKYLC